MSILICLHLTTPHFLGTIAVDPPGERGERPASRRAAMRPAIEFWLYTLASQLRSIPASRHPIANSSARFSQSKIPR